MNELKDWRGTDIKPGCIIVYPGRGGSGQWMTEAEVLEVEWRPGWRGQAVARLKVRRIRSDGGAIVGRVNSTLRDVSMAVVIG